jgi:hypothetical protein
MWEQGKSREDSTDTEGKRSGTLMELLERVSRKRSTLNNEEGDPSDAKGDRWQTDGSEGGKKTLKRRKVARTSCRDGREWRIHRSWRQSALDTARQDVLSESISAGRRGWQIWTPACLSQPLLVPSPTGEKKEDQHSESVPLCTGKRRKEKLAVLSARKVSVSLRRWGWQSDTPQRRW